jgi:uncharacterized protein (TIGR00369 family)
MTDIATAQAAFARALSSDRAEFGDFFLLRLFGMEVGYPGDACEVAFEAQRHLFNPQGTLHGGVLATALDISMGHLLARRAGPGATLEMKIQYMAPVRGGRVVCRGEMLREGRTSFLRSQALDAGGALVAYATATWKLLGAQRVGTGLGPE